MTDYTKLIEQLTNSEGSGTSWALCNKAATAIKEQNKEIASLKIKMLELTATNERNTFNKWVIENTGVGKLFSPGAQTSDFYFMIWCGGKNAGLLNAIEICEKFIKYDYRDIGTANFGLNLNECILAIRRELK